MSSVLQTWGQFHSEFVLELELNFKSQLELIIFLIELLHRNDRSDIDTPRWSSTYQYSKFAVTVINVIDPEVISNIILLFYCIYHCKFTKISHLFASIPTVNMLPNIW